MQTKYKSGHGNLQESQGICLTTPVRYPEDINVLCIVPTKSNESKCTLPAAFLARIALLI